MLGNKAKKGQLDLTVERRPHPEIPKEDIETFIQYGESMAENDAAVEYTKSYTYKLPESIRQNAKMIDEKLANIKICDPAIGSGAFPVGMMAEVAKARNVLSSYIKDQKRSIYNFKRECIEKSLYGVDIDPGAVEIAKLRLWLSLVVDEDDIKQIKPLPNLDYKIVCGNSLLSVSKNLFNNEQFRELERLKPLIFNETNPQKKQEYKEKIDNLISQITSGHKEFDFEVYFSEVFHEKQGFDVVIANPPYIFTREHRLSKEDKDYFYKNYSFIDYQLNTYLLFVERSFELLKNGGYLSFIIPKNWMTISSCDKFRHFLLSSVGNLQIIDIYDKVFHDASVDNSLLLFSKVKPGVVTLGEFKNGEINIIGKFEPNFFDKDYVINISLPKNQDIVLILSKIQSKSKTLKECATVSTGLKAYQIGKGIPPQTEEIKKSRIFHSSFRKNSTYQKYLEGSDVVRYRLGWSGQYLSSVLLK